MQCIRQILKPDNNCLTINLPESFSSHEVEIIAFPLENNKKIKTRSFTPSKFRGFLRNLNINAEVESRALRDEWQRDF